MNSVGLLSKTYHSASNYFISQLTVGACAVICTQCYCATTCKNSECKLILGIPIYNLVSVNAVQVTKGRTVMVEQFVANTNITDTELALKHVSFIVHYMKLLVAKRFTKE